MLDHACSLGGVREKFGKLDQLSIGRIPRVPTSSSWFLVSLESLGWVLMGAEEVFSYGRDGHAWDFVREPLDEFLGRCDVLDSLP
jgi:hypothetical protein